MRRSWIVVLAWLVAACSNSSGPAPVAVDRFPRLTHAQWEATVQDLFALPAPPGLSGSFTPDPPIGRFDNNIARLNTGSGLWQDYQRAAEQIAERVVRDPAALARIVPDRATADGRAIVTALGLHAFRRPLTDAEVDRYAALYATGATHFPQHDPVTAGVRIAIQTLLQSPYFLYRAELADTAKGGVIALTGYEVAARLSYMLWNTMPDDALLAAAGAGELDTAAGVRAQATRLLADPRAAAQLRRFHGQAFHTADYRDLDKSPIAFPTWRREVGSMMEEEVLRFLDDVVGSGGGVADMLTSTRAFVNADLARIYGLTGSFDASYQQVELDPATRAGLLTRAGFLAKNASLAEPDPIHRGVFVNLSIICRPINAVPNIPTDLVRTGNTNRERVTSITGLGTCGERCHHTIINPIGFAFERFDAIGAVRADDGGFPIDTKATYMFADGRTITYDDAVGLSRELAAAPELHACYVANLLELALGREVVEADREAVVDPLAARSLAERLPIVELILDIVSSDAFRTRTANGRS